MYQALSNLNLPAISYFDLNLCEDWVWINFELSVDTACRLNVYKGIGVLLKQYREFIGRD